MTKNGKIEVSHLISPGALKPRCIHMWKDEAKRFSLFYLHQYIKNDNRDKRRALLLQMTEIEYYWTLERNVIWRQCLQKKQHWCWEKSLKKKKESFLISSGDGGGHSRWKITKNSDTLYAYTFYLQAQHYIIFTQNIKNQKGQRMMKKSKNGKENSGGKKYYPLLFFQ